MRSAGEDMRDVVGWACGASCASPHWPPAACAMLPKHPVSAGTENCGVHDGVAAETTVTPAPRKPCVRLAAQHVPVEGVNEQEKEIPRRTKRERRFPWISQGTARVKGAEHTEAPSATLRGAFRKQGRTWGAPPHFAGLYQVWPFSQGNVRLG